MKLKIALLALTLTALTHSVAQAGHLHLEEWYQHRFCEPKHAQMEVVLSDGTRADCLLPSGYALEVDFARGKNFEAVGQALRYSRLTGLKPAILLIVESPGDQRHVDGTKADIKYHKLDVKVWTIRP